MMVRGTLIIFCEECIDPHLCARSGRCEIDEQSDHELRAIQALLPAAPEDDPWWFL